MTTFLASLLRLLAHALVVGALALGQGNAVLLAFARGTSCECAGCCTRDEDGGACCARKARAPAGPVWKERAGRCGCNTLPNDPAPSPGITGLAPRCEARGKSGVTHGLAPLAPLALVHAFPRDGALDPPPRPCPDPRAGRNGAFLDRSGPERSALLGCARL